MGRTHRATAGGRTATADLPMLRVIVSGAIFDTCILFVKELIEEGRVVVVDVAIPVDVGQESAVQRVVGVANDIASIGGRQVRREVANIVVVSNSVTIDIPVTIVDGTVAVTVGLANVAESIVVAVSLVGIRLVAIVASIAYAIAVRVSLVRIRLVAIVASIAYAVAVRVILVRIEAGEARVIAMMNRLVRITVVARIAHQVTVVIREAGTPRAGGANCCSRLSDDADVQLVGITEIERVRGVVGDATCSGLTAFVVQPVSVRIPTGGSGACGSPGRAAAFRDIQATVR